MLTRARRLYEQERVLAGVSRALKPGGRTLFQVGGQGNLAGFFAVADLGMAGYPWKSYFTGFKPTWRFCSEREYAGLLQEAGVEGIRTELIPVDMVHQNRSGLEGWGRTTWLPFLEKLPNCKKEEFFTGLTDRYLAFYPTDPEGRTHVKRVRLEVGAVKRFSALNISPHTYAENTGGAPRQCPAFIYKDLSGNTDSVSIIK